MSWGDMLVESGAAETHWAEAQMSPLRRWFRRQLHKIRNSMWYYRLVKWIGEHI